MDNQPWYQQFAYRFFKWVSYRAEELEGWAYGQSGKYAPKVGN
jgi:hypothetical protein